MRRKIGSKFQCGVSAAVLAAAASVAGVSSSQAGIIYQDNFARGTVANPDALNGSTPAPVDTNSATWSAFQTNTGSNIVTNGSEAVLPSVGRSVGYLPLTLAASETYVFSATLTPGATSSDTNSQDWLGMGFSNQASEASSADIYAGGSEAWLIYRGNSGTQSFYGGAGSNGASGGYANSNHLPPAPSDTFTITLTTPANLASGGASVSFYDSLGLVGTLASPRHVSLTNSELSTINDISVGSFNWGGTISNVELAVPEPATLGLLGAGGLGLLLVGRKRKTV